MWRYKDACTAPTLHVYCSVIGNSIEHIFATPLNGAHAGRMASKYGSSPLSSSTKLEWSGSQKGMRNEGSGVSNKTRVNASAAFCAENRSSRVVKSVKPATMIHFLQRKRAVLVRMPAHYMGGIGGVTVRIRD